MTYDIYVASLGEILLEFKRAAEATSEREAASRVRGAYAALDRLNEHWVRHGT